LATDLAKISPHILSPERFALHLGTYLVSKYAHIHRAFITLEKLRWSRITLSGNVDPHPHSSLRDGNDQTVEVENLILFMIIEDPVLIRSIYHRSPIHMGESSPMTLQSIPRFHLQSDIDHLLLGTTVIDANGRCTQCYDGAGPTDVCMDHRASGLVRSLWLHLLQTIRKYFMGSRTWPSTYSREAMFCLSIYWPYGRY
ncbi:hypothetical protein CY34DRAFT_813965, partial [Suillus luteus UH-Slu-Lm8-n1]